VNCSRVDAVIISKLDRLTRSVKDLCSLLELFERRFALISVAESLMAAVPKWEWKAIGERTRDVLRHKRNSGERVGHMRFGFRLSPDGKHVEPDPGPPVLAAGARTGKLPTQRPPTQGPFPPQETAFHAEPAETFEVGNDFDPWTPQSSDAAGPSRH